MILEKRPQTVEAVKFEGGPESAQEVIEWARARDRHMVISWTPEVLNDGEREIREALYIIVASQSKHNDLRGGQNRTFRVNAGDWLVLDKHNHVTYSSDGFDLFKGYKEVPDAEVASS